MDNRETHKLHSWMYTLLYPAVLGSMIVATISAATSDQMPLSGEKLAFTIFLMAYFTSQHVENVDDAQGYNRRAFVADVAEIGLMYSLFVLLSVVNVPWVTKYCSNLIWGWFYVLLVLTFIVPVLQRLVQIGGKSSFQGVKGVKSWLSILAVVIAVTRIGSVSHSTIIGLLSVVLAFYLVAFVFWPLLGGKVAACLAPSVDSSQSP